MQCNERRGRGRGGEVKSFNKIILNAQNFLFCFPFAHTHTQKYFSNNSAAERANGTSWRLKDFCSLIVERSLLIVACCIPLYLFSEQRENLHCSQWAATALKEFIFIIHHSTAAAAKEILFSFSSSLSLSYLHKELFHRDDKRNKTVAVVLLTFT